jgi:hypothetical protein
MYYRLTLKRKVRVCYLYFLLKAKNKVTFNIDRHCSLISKDASVRIKKYFIGPAQNENYKEKQV